MWSGSLTDIYLQRERTANLYDGGKRLCTYAYITVFPESTFNSIKKLYEDMAYFITTFSRFFKILLAFILLKKMIHKTKIKK